MKDLILLILRLLAGLITLLAGRGTRAVLAENLLLKQQLLVMQRSRRRAPNLRTPDRLLFGFCALFLSPRRVVRTAIILKPSTRLRFHRGLKGFQYRFLYASGSRSKPGPKGPSAELIRAICELKRRNPRFGCPKIAQHLAKTFERRIRWVDRILDVEYDNAAMESFRGTFKGKCLGGGRLRDACRRHDRLLRLCRNLLRPGAAPQRAGLQTPCKTLVDFGTH